MGPCGRAGRHHFWLPIAPVNGTSQAIFAGEACRLVKVLEGRRQSRLCGRLQPGCLDSTRARRDCGRAKPAGLPSIIARGFEAKKRLRGRQRLRRDVAAQKNRVPARRYRNPHFRLPGLDGPKPVFVRRPAAVTTAIGPTGLWTLELNQAERRSRPVAGEGGAKAGPRLDWLTLSCRVANAVLRIFVCLAPFPIPICLSPFLSLWSHGLVGRREARSNRSLR